MNDDMELVREYAARQSEPAFETLVARNVGLVHSAALRQLRDPHLAEEITQTVFIILARKAGSLNPKTILPGWLYRTTHYVSGAALKIQHRRERREQEAHMEAVMQDNQTDPAWEQFSPLLDEAMADLRDKDRDAIVLRYFQNWSLRDVGAALGVDEYAAQKRVARALEKLRMFFIKRGVDSTAATIAEAVSANSIQAVPALLAKSVTAVAVAKGAATSVSTLTLIKGALKIMAWTKAKTAVVASVALILTTGTSIVVFKAAHSTRTIHLPVNGLPQTLAELNAWYVEPPGGQNAATFNLQGFKALQIGGAAQNANLPILGKLPPPFPFTPLPLPEKSALAAFVQRNRDALQFFAQGAQHEHSRYPLDFNQGQQLQLPHLPKIKSGTQVAELAAILDAENNDGKQAADDVLTTLALARSLNAEPMLISQLVRVASVAVAVASLEQGLNRVTLPPESLSELSQAFGAMERCDAQGEGLNRSLIGEKVMVTAAFKNTSIQELPTLAAQDATDEQRQRLVQLLKQPGGLKDEQDYLETTFGQFLTARKEDFPERLKDAAVVQRRATETTNGELLINNGWLTGYANIVSKEAKCLADLRLALTAVALEQFRARHSQYPATLSELTPNYLDATPLDPFDGQPLRYRRLGAGYLLYSIGPDLKDNGGERMTANGGDLVFTVVTPPSP